MVEVVGLDGDDTLWHSESLFAVTQERFTELLAPYVDADQLEAELLATERRNLVIFGYGVKGFTLSMVETAIAVSDDRVTASEVSTILGWGRAMLSHPVELLDGAEETVRALAADHRLLLVTKGDLFHQESKVAASGLADHFEHIAIVAEKDPGTYRRLVAGLGVDPSRFLMVGNSVPSDVLPVLEVGGRAVHVPYHVTWALETASEPEAHDGYWRLDDLRQLPGLLGQLQAG